MCSPAYGGVFIAGSLLWGVVAVGSRVSVQWVSSSLRIEGKSMGPPVVVMGVSGSGKSTVGAELARRLSVPFADADDVHPAANIAKMTAGHPLDDADRRSWLESVGAWLAAHADGGVMSCSALKRSYRERLRRHCPNVQFLHLAGSPEVIVRRQANRPGHFMPAALLTSQFETLEPLRVDEDGLTLDVDQEVDSIVGQYISARQRAQW